MCIAGSRRGSGESCYQELATEAHGPRQSQLVTVETATQPVTLILSPPPPAIATTVVSPAAVAAAAAADNDLREQEKQTAEITVDGAEQNAVFVRISEEDGGALRKTSGMSSEPKPPLSSPSPPLLPPPKADKEDIRGGVSQRRRLSETERILLESLDIGRCRPRHTGRFLTMHKRRRKRLTTRSLNQEPGILDDIFHGMVQCVLQKAGNWRFNAFTLETVTGGRSLPVLCVHLFHWYGLFRRFNLDVVTVWKLFAFIEEGYHSTNPYHNSIHATDVTQAMHCFLQEEKIRRHLTDLEIMASLIAAVTHDLDHPGVNQPFLVATSNHLAALYQNTSVLENHHWRSAIGCLIESGVSDQLPAEVRPELQRHISSLILATDITRQQEFLTRFKHYLDERLLDMERAEDRHFILQIALKCADISNPCRPWDISRKWSYKVCEEFFRQGDYERQLNLPVTPLCDRHTTSIPKIQVGFFKFVVTPLYEEWHRFLGDEFSASLMDYLHANQKKWEGLILQENAEETKTEISELEEVDNIVSSGDEELAEEDSGSIDLLIAAEYIQSCRRPSLPGKMISARVGRRHSVPLSLSKPLTLFANAGERRESLPNEQSKIRNPLLKLEDQSLLDPSTLSLLSSRSSVVESSTNASIAERPVSAENLLPETSIASITNSTEASRLSTVLQGENLKSGAQGKQLTRQQTFPPLQPCVRHRYMSTTAEMVHCYTQILVEADGSSSPSLSPTRDQSCSGGRCGTPPVADIGSSRKLNILRSSRELCVTDIAGKKRVSPLSEVARLKKESECEQPRRHSMQTLRASSPVGSKQRNKRPSSAQETDSTRIFYESLTSSYGEKDAERRGSSDSSTEQKLRADSRTSLSSSGGGGGSSNRCVVLPCVRPDVQCVVIDTDSRRYSTPETRTKPCEPLSGRRFTTIPVSSELSTHKVFFIGSPPDSPPRVQSVSSSSDSGSDHRRSMAEQPSESVSLSGKRDSDSFREKSPKIAKLSLEGQMKENVDPKTLSAEDPDKCHALPKRGSQGWARRRGSAPVGLLSRLDDITVTPVTRIDYSSRRRGSVPTDIIRHQGGGFSRLTLGPRGENLPETRRASLPQETAFGSFLGNFLLSPNERENCPMNNYNNNNNNGASNNNGFPKCSDMNPPAAGMPSPRRGSVPADISELRRDLLGRSSVNGKSRNRKKVLRRRSSGGPEMFAGGGSGGSVETNENGTWLKWKREAAKRDSIPEPVVKRRGSLPIEMVAVSHAGSTSGPRRSSLWRF